MDMHQLHMYVCSSFRYCKPRQHVPVNVLHMIHERKSLRGVSIKHVRQKLSSIDIFCSFMLFLQRCLSGLMTQIVAESDEP